MKNFRHITESVKKLPGGKIFKSSDQQGGKISIMIGKNKDIVNITLNNEYYVATGKEVEDIISLFK